MITKETITIAGKEYQHTFSDTFKIKKDGTEEVYDDAIDNIHCAWTYSETDIPLEQEETQVIEEEIQ